MESNRSCLYRFLCVNYNKIPMPAAAKKGPVFVDDNFLEKA